MNTGPDIGDYRPENGETLDEFLAAQLKTAAGRQRHLETRDHRHQYERPPSSPQFVVNWSLSFGHGLKADTRPGPRTDGGRLTATPIAGGVGPANDVTSGLSVPSSPIDIGLGLVMAQDNTLGAYSPYEGRIYAAFVGYINVKVDGFTEPRRATPTSS